ncbi:C40 family peptidase [Pseudomonas fulva]|uniref:Hydrolase Nlp/P60 n=1 Tax=Pseudomonas parafulva TaxID=157782 RepID=A0AAJ0LHD2_9PSED|nr:MULTISPECIES: C40 family peptidase [Pseudomonas]HAL68388.1 peptidoglycan endopeptidase [Pseudomonas sp.]AQW69555.1 hydrolase Nlp/P60 [Pseudomonas parafulva]AUA34116.1 NlpC/P60 family protein [Pseudomonas sp. SGAir0191]KTS94467.1 hydrolase Nlp/P60 [Pseudomonas parafulva]KTT15885.1 hydrolase Nlp/P60 [Pseudomonas parafulva]
MTTMARFAFISLAALLAACSSQPQAPAPTRVVQPQVTYSQPSFSPTADDVLIRAIGLVGTPYRWGGNTPDSGFDCSGLIKYVYRDAAGISLPRSTREMIGMRAPTVDVKSLQSGDLVFFATSGGSQVSHAGIYVGDGRFVHAPRTGGTVRLDYLSNSYWAKAYLQAKRVIPQGHLAQNP